MWVVFAFGSAIFAGITAILAKCGIRETDSTVATAIRTIIVLLFSWLMVFVAGVQSQIVLISAKTWLFLILSGMATGASWLCYFRALQIGDINKVVPIDKSSVILTILLSFLFLHEEINVPKAFGVILIGAGTFLMIEKKNTYAKQKETRSQWFFYAVGSAVFASLTSILGKIGISGVESNLGTALRTGVVLVMAWLMVFVTGKQHSVKGVSRKELTFIATSGLATGASWLCYYRALQDGPASVVVPIDKLSILVTVLFSYLVFGERLSKKSGVGLVIIVAGLMVQTVSAGQNAITLDEERITLYTGQSKTLTYRIGSFKTNADKWVSTNSACASVNSSGKVTGKKAGTATIKAGYYNSYLSQYIYVTCKVTVKAPAIKLSKASAALKKGQKLTLKATVYGKSKTVKWMTSKKSIATVNRKGVVTGKKPGTVTITATANGKKASCKIKVSK